MVCHLQVEAVAYIFESMAERSMSYIMNKRGSKGTLHLAWLGSLLTQPTFDDRYELSSSMEYPDAMRETGVCSTRKYKIGKTKLLNAPETLERPCLNNTPKRVFKLIGLKFDEIMKRIAYALVPT
jgi:hypothetical protein